jgi:inositol-phosphate phosphatase/L-galactose 1-phosphate phosphatase/histidinol-phosphatase
MQELLLLANHMADESGTVIRGHFRRNFDVESKADATPVTIADRSAEAKLREIIERERPDDGIMGEEYGPKDSRNGYTWVLDPIDGTKSFVIGRPTFGTLIALCKDGVPVLGIIDQPILKERWVGDCKQTTFNGVEVTTRKCADLKSARVASTSPSQLPDLWETLYKECSFMVWGGDCYSYGLLANGRLDCVIESGMAVYDYMALVPVVQGAGGWMGNWNSEPLTLNNHEKSGKTIAVGDATLKNDFLELLR